MGCDFLPILSLVKYFSPVVGEGFELEALRFLSFLEVFITAVYVD